MRGFRKAPESPIADVAARVAAPSFVCRTCGAAKSFYVAQQVTNWNHIGQIFRRDDGSFAYRTYNSFLPGTDGPPLRYCCTNCNTSAVSLGDLLRDTRDSGGLPSMPDYAASPVPEEGQ